MQRSVVPADAATTLQLKRVLWRGDETPRDDDTDILTREEPLEIRVGTLPLAVLMRTPGHDLDLVAGFALSEGIFKSFKEISRIVPCEQPGTREDERLAPPDNSAPHAGSAHPDSQVMRIIPEPHVELDALLLSRNFYSTSSCGICGKRSIEMAMKVAPPLTRRPHFRARLLAEAPYKLRDEQHDFDKTGALHAAGLLNQSGDLLAVREDIGRHNAVDKVIGWALRSGHDLSHDALIVSGRISFEIVQKSLAVGISCLVGVGGVSSLACELAQTSGIAVAGFARTNRLSIYNGAERFQ